MEKDEQPKGRYVTHRQVEDIIDVKIKPLENTVHKLDEKTDSLTKSYESLNITLIEVQVTNKSLNDTIGQLMHVLEEMQKSDAVQEYRIGQMEEMSRGLDVEISDAPVKTKKEANADIIKTTITVVGALLTSILATFFGS